MRGKLIVFSGPSGVGKGTIREQMRFNNFKFSISLTTRAIRPGETDGIDYHYVTREFFEKRIEGGKMLEHAEFVGNYYGTDLEFVNRELDNGKNVFLEIECQGALQVLDKMEDVISIFIIPPSMEELESRLRSRGTEDEETLQKRLAKAREELDLKDHYKYVVTNDEVHVAAEKVDTILTKEMNRA